MREPGYRYFDVECKPSMLLGWRRRRKTYPNGGEELTVYVIIVPCFPLVFGRVKYGRG